MHKIQNWADCEELTSVQKEKISYNKNMNNKKEHEIIKEILHDIKMVKVWDGKGWSESFVMGYKKAHEQFENTIKKWRKKRI